jgi:hypothetical protein
MKTKFSFIDPGAIMGVVVALVILGVGTFAFFVTVQSINNQAPAAGLDYTDASNASNNSRYYFQSGVSNTTGVGNQVFNIIGVIMIIGAIMSIVGLVYNYVR